MVYKGVAGLKRFLFPSTCVLCGENGGENRDLCAVCESTLPRIEAHCDRCGVPVASGENALCGRCLRQPPGFDRVLSPLRYEQPVDWLVQRLKYNACLSHARVLGGLLCDYLARVEPDLPDIIVPVPLHRTRLSERGFNQALELARPVARHFSVPIDIELCQRHVDTPQQSVLPAKRRTKNLRNAFSLLKDPRIRSIAIVDDVVTTGATVNALAGLMKRNGVERVQVWAVARTETARM